MFTSELSTNSKWAYVAAAIGVSTALALLRWGWRVNRESRFWPR